MSWIGYFLRAGIDPVAGDDLEVKRDINLIGKSLKVDGVTNVGFNEKVTTISQSVGDDASVTLPKGYPGLLIIGVEDDDWGILSVTAAGVVEKHAGSANMVTTDTDTKTCFFKGASDVPTIRNRLGATKVINAVFIRLN